MGRQRSQSRFLDLLMLSERVADPFVVILSGLLAYIIRFGFDYFPIPLFYLAFMLVTALMVLLLFPLFGLYPASSRYSLFDSLGRVFAAWSTVLLVMASLLFLSKTGERFSRLWFGEWLLVSITLLSLMRISLHIYFRRLQRRGWSPFRVVIFGAGGLGSELAERIDSRPWSEFGIHAFMDDNRSPGDKVMGVPVESVPDEALVGYLEENEIDEFWIALPLRAEKRIEELISALRLSTVNIRFAPNIYHLRLFNFAVTDVAGVPMFDLSSSPMAGANRVIKALEDYLLSAIILLLCSPLLLLIALAIKLSSPGPVLFRQRRNGWQGEEIGVLKFRTMEVHESRDGILQQAKRDDPRVTRIGAFLRKTSLDELPQFVNVLKGDMSIVGPRPHAVEHNELYKSIVDRYALRHKVKPGITGWAQVNGCRGETDKLEKMEKRVEFDLYYIENWSIWFDIRIIFLTLLRGFNDPQAY